jgi:WD40 repeat protein
MSKEKKKYDVFISYSHENVDFAKKIFHALTNYKISTFIDKDAIKPGYSFVSKINNIIKEAKTVLLIYSNEYFKKNWTEKEYEAALAEGKKIIGLLIDDCELPPLLKPSVYIDFRKKNDYKTKIIDLLNCISDPPSDDQINSISNNSPSDNQIYEIKEIFSWLGYHTNDENLEIEQKLCKKTIFKALLSFYPYTKQDYKNVFQISFNKRNDQNKGMYTYPDLIDDLLPLRSFLEKAHNNFQIWIEERANKKDVYIEPYFMHDDHSNVSHPNAYQYIDNWLTKDSGNFLVLLGDLGTGKTTTSRYLAKNWAEKFKEDAYHNPAPIYIELKKEMKNCSFEFIIENHFKNSSCPDISIQNFFRLWNRGKIVLIIDAFDVVAEGENWEKQKERFLAFCPRNKIAKAILTCRTHYFKSIDEQKDLIAGSSKKLYKEIKEYKPETRVIYLKEFTDKQIKEYLENHREDPVNDLKTIKSIYHLERIARRPLLLDMIIKSLPKLDKNKPISSVGLYKEYTEIWIQREETDNDRKIMDQETKFKLMLELAWRMWEQSRGKIHHTELTSFLEKENPKIKDTDKHDIQRILHDTMTASFLKRDQQGNFSFMHKSFQEYFLARKIYEVFLTKELNTNILQTHLFQKEMIFFLQQMDHDESIVNPLQTILKNSYQAKNSENAVNLLYWKARYDCNMKEQIDINRLKVFQSRTKQLIPAKIKLQTSTLNEIDLSGAYLEKADFSYSNLSNASFEYTILDHSKLDNTDLSHACLNHASMQYANLSNANIDNASFDHTDLTGIDHTGIQHYENAKLQHVTGINYKDIGLKKLYKPVVQSLGHCDRAITTDISPDKKYSASGGADGLVLIYEISNYRILWALEGHTGMVNMVRFAHNRLILASSSSDKTVRIWDICKGKEISTPKLYDAPVSCIAFSKDDQLLASSSANQIIIWDLKHNKKIVQESFEPFVIDLAFSDIQSLYAKDIEQNEWHWQISEDGLIPLNKGVDIETRVHKEELVNIQPGHKSGILSLITSCDGNYIASANMNGTIRIWDFKKGLHHYLQEHDAAVTCVKFINPITLISCGYDEIIRKWDVQKGKCIRFWRGHSNYINDIAYSKPLDFIASASNDRTIALWDTELNKEASLEKHDDWVKTICFSKDGKLLVSGGRDHKVILWDLASRRPLHIFKGHSDEITKVLFSDNQKNIISASMDRTIRIWNIKTKEHHVLKGHEEGIKSLCMASGTILASGGRDNTIRLWDLSKNLCHTVLTGNMGQVNAICCSHNNRVLISAGDAGRIQIWDYKRKNCILMLYAFDHDAWMFLMPDGRYHATDKALSYLGYTEQDTLSYYKASNLKKDYSDPEAIGKVIERYLVA